MRLKNIFKTLLITSAIGSSLASCTNDFLKEDYTTNYSTDRFQTQEGLDELTTGTYTKLKFQFNYVWAINIYNLGVDEFTDANNSGPAYNCYSADLSSTETGSNQPVWDNMYAAIESANTLIQNIPLYYDENSDTYETRLGEAYFFRGYFYFQLVQEYGGVPLKLNPSTTVETYFTRETSEDCYGQIISDLEEAYQYLPASVSQTGRLTQSAAAHFLAKAHLTRASEINDDWNSSYVDADLTAVIKYAKEVVAAHPLATDYADLWDYQYANSDNETNSEIVLAAQFSDDATTWGRYGNQMHLYYPSVYMDLPGCTRDISGDREFSFARSTNYAMDVFDRVNDSRFWKSFITCYGSNNTSAAPSWNSSNYMLAPAGVNPIIEIAADGDTVFAKRFNGGELGIKYIVNNAGDERYTDVDDDATGVMKNGEMQPTHTFVRYFEGEDQAWVGQHGNNGYYGVQKRSVALSKYRDGYRTAISSQFGTRDGIIARSAEDVLMVAEAYIRQGNYDDAIPYFNQLRTRGAYKAGEDRSAHIDGGQAYANNAYCEGKGGGYSAEGAIFWNQNTYYESNNDMAVTTAATTSAMTLNSQSDILDSDVDSPIYEKLGCTSDADKMMCFLMNERTRELCGEQLRWKDLARTKTLESRWKAFNDGYVRGNTVFNANTHYLRPIPQSFLDGITNESGSALTAEEKSAMQNPGY
ncbi:RagB/SusD family nutrient uptake outer membrane protein [Mangrovibacterium marinum]|uniref:Putative outer membrane starch-binding protein n=1 Tax=Mangrovibacterium marinum TaxID=1639118 RepID=A0A2T5C0N7_9BACT|nr:RagB/SusD family nutrient uptake outer membrane protein [Mangrovibacterium marinum]PTN08166.1 putative outer membrane starch-binding protein [Mangrovibacterium marinum]